MDFDDKIKKMEEKERNSFDTEPHTDMPPAISSKGPVVEGSVDDILSVLDTIHEKPSKKDYKK